MTNYKTLEVERDRALIRRVDHKQDEVFQKTKDDERKAHNRLKRASEMKKRSKNKKVEVIRPTDKKQLNKFFETQSKEHHCGKSCMFSKPRTFAHQNYEALRKELRRHGTKTTAGKKQVLRALLKEEYDRHGLDVSNLPS